MGIYSQARSFVGEFQDSYYDDYKDIDIIGTLMEAETEIKRVDQLVFESLLELDFVSIVEGEEGDSSNDGKKDNKIIEAFRNLVIKVKDAIIKAWNAFMQKIQEMINSKALKDLDNAYNYIKTSPVKSIKTNIFYPSGERDSAMDHIPDIKSYKEIIDLANEYIENNYNEFFNTDFSIDNKVFKVIHNMEVSKDDFKYIMNNKHTEKEPSTSMEVKLDDLKNIYNRLMYKNIKNDIAVFKKYLDEVKRNLDNILVKVGKSENDIIVARRYKVGSALASLCVYFSKECIKLINDTMKTDRKIFLQFYLAAKKANKKGNDNTDTDNSTDTTNTGESVDLTSSIIDLESDLYMESLFGL